jgi:hypothetical protein
MAQQPALHDRHAVRARARVRAANEQEKLMTREELERMTGAEQLRLIVSNIDHMSETFLDMYTLEEIVQLYRMCLLSGFDVYPDQWTRRQVRAALQGIPPSWDNDEKPVYLKGKERRTAKTSKIKSAMHGRTR